MNISIIQPAIAAAWFALSSFFDQVYVLASRFLAAES